MIRLKNLIMEQEDSKQTDSDLKDINIRVNYIAYETNYRWHDIPGNNDLMSADFAKEMVDFILDRIESENIRNPETGEYEYDVTRLNDDITFDCCIQRDDSEIDFHARYNENADLERIELHDPDLAESLGITESDLYELLS